MKTLFLALALFALACNIECKHWALIIAGSNGWYNYRHQADVCHAYQILHKNGIPDENIVVMMYDDIANNRQNPTPGKVINKPDGPDVYEGVPKDYTGEDVTPENFLNVLQGKSSAMNGIGSGKVIASGPDDNVFVYFADHGAPDIIAFPTSELHSKDLQEAITNMDKNNQYKQMVFYIEACESGSMFNRHKLATNINVFATTAANGAESSYACYFDKARETYLGDVYSIKWLENSDTADFSSETLSKQFKVVKEETNTSHVMEFGDLTMGDLVLGLFQGENSNNGMVLNTTKVTPPVPITDAVPSPDVALWILYHKLMDHTKSPEERQHLLREMEHEQETRFRIRSTFHKVVEKLVWNPSKQKEIIKTPAALKEHVCYKAAVTKFRQSCYDYNKYEHALRHIYILANLCDAGFQTETVTNAIEKICSVAH